MPTANKKLVKFNVQNPQYALAAPGGAWGTPKPLGDARKMALESDTNTKKIYGNGRVVCVIVNDKGKTATLTVNTVPDGYEIDMGRKLRTANGLADIKQTVSRVHCVYFETCEISKDDGDADVKTTVAKTWLYNAVSKRPSESYEQTEDDTSESTFDVAFEVSGLPVLNADGTAYKQNGVEVYAWQTTVTPEDDGYDTFGDAVRLPILPAPQGE
ncbi:MAG: hypothetical protein LBL66_04790 [Clostridiales bacterium]|nr:hypothetical protein [Clostridiales bacterium]